LDRPQQQNHPLPERAACAFVFASASAVASSALPSSLPTLLKDDADESDDDELLRVRLPWTGSSVR